MPLLSLGRFAGRQQGRCGQCHGSFNSGDRQFVIGSGEEKKVSVPSQGLTTFIRWLHLIAADLFGRGLGLA